MNNDLISRSELKKAIENYLEKRQDVIIWETDMLNMLDNAPTVELTEEQAIDKLHETGWLIRHDKVMTERPQGEWENDSDNLPICNKCGEIALQRIFVKMPHLIQDVRMVRSNYCPNCGAEMKDGAK